MARKKWTMEDRHRTARAAGYESYQDRLARQRYFKATGDRSVLPSGTDPKSIKGSKAAIPSTPAPADSPIGRSMRRFNIAPGSVPLSPVEVRGNSQGSVHDAGNVNASIRAQARDNPRADFTLTYVVKDANGAERRRSIVKSGASWSDYFDGGHDIEDAAIDDISAEYGTGSWRGSISTGSAGSWSVSGF